MEWERMSSEIFKLAENLLAARQVKEALRLFDEAERMGFDPDLCAAARWNCHMLLGDFARAWRESEAIARRGKPDPHRFWDGRPLDGRNVILRCLHGLGDTIQFIRYAPWIRQRARSLIVEAQPLLKALIAHSDLADYVMTWGEPEPFWDQQVEVVELPRIFQATLDSIPAEVPYLRAPASVLLSAGQQARLCVGIVWASSDYNPARSIPLALMARLFSVPRVRFFSLQAGPRRQELEPWRERVQNLYDEHACVLATARNVQALDLVITVDTMMAHLAGALGRPVWTLLPFASDWRWMLEREDSPWYPTMRLFRQTRPGDWEGVVERVARELRVLSLRAD
jgi:pentatricopeptide repeat protein